MNISDAKLQANRRNAQKSTGPKTAAGQAASKLNALKHGLLAQNIVVSGPQFQESSHEFKELCHQFYTCLSPVGPLEELLVDQIVQASWRLRRARTAEAGEIVLSVDEGCSKRQRKDQRDPWPLWLASGDAVREMENSGIGNRLMSDWLLAIRRRVQQEGELSDAALKIPMHGAPNHLSNELAEWRQQCSSPPAGLDPAAQREESKIKLMAKIDARIALLFDREEECRSRAKSVAQAHQSATVLPAAQTLDRILRYETALEKQLYRAMNQLERLQRRRLGETVAAPPAVDLSAHLGSEILEVKITKRTQRQNAKPPLKSAHLRPEPRSHVQNEPKSHRRHDLDPISRSVRAGCRIFRCACGGWRA